MLRPNNFPTSPVEFMFWDKDLCRYATRLDVATFCKIDDDFFGSDEEFRLQCYGRFKKLAYTGMDDKRKRRIYEGFIVKAKYKTCDKEYTRIGVIGFEKASFVLIEANHDISQLSAFESDELEIIGSIFLNPELLEVHECEK